MNGVERVTRRKVTLVECDVDGSTVGVTSWTLRPEGGVPRKVDLCEKHAAPLVELHEGGARTRAKMQKTTLEEIEASKTAAKKTASRRKKS